MNDEKTPHAEGGKHENKIDDAVEGTFPASDPPQNTPAEGSRKAEQIEKEQSKGG